MNEKELQKTIKSLLDVKMLNHDSQKVRGQVSAATESPGDLESAGSSLLVRRI